MNALLTFLVAHGGMLLIGATILLAIGAGVLLLQRDPIHRQRTGEITLVAVLCWLVLACIPLPRWSLDRWLPVAANSSTTAPETKSPATPLPAAFGSAPVVVESPDAEAARIAETAKILDQIAQLDAQTGPVIAPLNPIEEKLQNAATPSPVPSVATPIDWQQSLAAAYLSGSVLCGLWIVLGVGLLARLTRRATEPDEWLARLYASLSDEPLPRLLVSAKCRRAFSCGWWRPTIILPADCCGENRAAQLRQILLHELAHLRQGDQRGRLLFNAALPLLYLHPLYWWIRSRTYLAAELVADDWAAGHSSTTDYAGELIALVKEQGRRGMAHVGAIGIFSSPTQFYRRMEMLVRRQTPLMTHCTRRWRLWTTTATTAAVIVLGGVLGVGLVHAEPDDDTPPAETNNTAAATPDTKESKPPAATPAAGEESGGQKTHRGGRGRGGFGARSGNVLNTRGARRSDGGTSSETNLFGGGTSLRSGGDDDDEGGMFGGAGRGFGRRRSTPEDLAASIKSLHRDVLIMRLQLLNRPVTEQEREIRNLLTDKKATNEELIERLYKNVLKRPINDEELALVKQIVALSDDRTESIRRVLESLGQHTAEASAALIVLELEPQFVEVESNLGELTKQTSQIPTNRDELEQELSAETKSQLKIETQPGTAISSWFDVVQQLYLHHARIKNHVRVLKKKMADLTTLDKELRHGAPSLINTSRTHSPTQDLRRSRQDVTYPAATPATTKPAPVVVERKTPNGIVRETAVQDSTAAPTTVSQSDVKVSTPSPSHELVATPPAAVIPAGNIDAVSLALDYSTTKSKAALAEKTFERIKTLHERGVSTNDQLNKAEEELKSQQRRIEILLQVAQVLRKAEQADLLAAHAELEAAQKSKDEVKAQQARAKVVRAEGNLSILDTMKEEQFRGGGGGFF